MRSFFYSMQLHAVVLASSLSYWEKTQIQKSDFLTFLPNSSQLFRHSEFPCN